MYLNKGEIMAEFFYLLPEYKVAFGDNGGCLYNTKNGKMISIDHEYSKVLKNSIANKEIDSNNNIIKELVDKGMGMLLNAPAMQENLIDSSMAGKNKLVYSNSVLQRLYIQITNQCNLNCSFCDNGSRVVTRTHCKRWEHESVSFSPEEWNGILKQAANLGTKEIRIIGGNPFLKMDELKKVHRAAKENKITKFWVYTNLTFINEEILDYIGKEKINIIVELTEYGKAVKTNIARLVEKGVNCLVQITMTEENSKSFQQITTELMSLGITQIGVDYVYDGDVRIDERNTKFFGKVTSQCLEMYQTYNSCLFGQLYINSAGDMTPCPMMNDYILGNVRKDDLFKVIAADKYQDMVCLSRSKLKGCSRCAFRYNCMDCRALESSATGDIRGVAFCKEYDDMKLRVADD